MMMTSLMSAVLLLAAPVQAFVTPIARHAVAGGPPRAAVAFMSADLVPPDGGEGALSVLDAALLFITLGVAVQLFAVPESQETDTADSKSSGVSGFGWLQADLRMPLPSLEELQQTCHLVGNHQGKHVFLCADAGQDAELSGCAISDDFSTYYGQPVYVCAGGDAGSRRFDGAA